jgi:hypothetical protein
MGQARNRGTFEERKAQAIARNQKAEQKPEYRNPPCPQCGTELTEGDCASCGWKAKK